MGIVNMPKMGDTMQEGTIAKWYKRIGDHIKEGEVIAEIETEKAAIEIEAFESGLLTRIIVEEGGTVPVGAPIAEIGGPGGGTPTPAGSAPEPAKAPAPAAPPPVPRGAENRVVASPLARRIAHETGTDLFAVRGTGPGGRIVAQDVRDHSLTGGRDLEPVAPSPAPPTPATAPAEVWGSAKPASRMRQVIARRMAESKQNVPHFYVTADIDMAPAMRLRERLNARGDEFPKISPNDLVVKAVADALRAQPAMRVAYGGDHVLSTDQVNVGIAVALPDGLIVPVIRGADSKPLVAIALEARSLAEKARAGKLLPDDYAGGTFTVTNLGMFGMTEFQAIVNPPEPGILAVGAIAEVPVVVEGAVTAGVRMKATLSADHRVVDGAVGAQFLQEVKRRLENPLLLVR